VVGIGASAQSVASPVVLAVEAGPPAFLAQIAALVVAAAVIGYACARLRIVPIVGFLLAGVLIGPDALGIVREREIIDAAAEVGVILLLFTIGIEFSIGRLLAIRRLVLLGGSLQVAGAVALTTGVLVLAGVELRAALFTGLLVSLSSTAIVLKLLGDRGSTSSAVGRTSLGLLIFQDLAVVAMVLLLPVLGESGAGGGGPLARALLTALAVVVVTLVVARRVLPPVLEAVARACSPEVFLLSVIALCLGTAYLTALAGVSVSLGAFLAGLVVSESRHSRTPWGRCCPCRSCSPPPSSCPSGRCWMCASCSRSRCWCWPRWSWCWWSRW
jgi:CPA2 family monovalent cation:H+ antiporter-2